MQTPFRLSQLCKPKVSDNIVVATAAQRKRAGNIAGVWHCTLPDLR
jgi:hypothetical protein